MKISRFSINHPVIITMSLLILIVFSIISYTNLAAQFLPDISQPQAYIITTYPGVSAKRVDKEVSKIISDVLVTIPGITEMTTNSRDSVSVILLKFSEDEDMNSLLPVIREKLNIVQSSLPNEITSQPEIHVSSVATYLPIYSFAVQGEVDLIELTRYCENIIVPSLYNVKGVSKVEVSGGKYTEVEIRLHLEKLNAKGISILNVMELLKSSNISIPSGKEVYQNKEINIRTAGEFKSLKEIEDMIVGYKDGSPIYMKNISTVKEVLIKPNIYITNRGDEVPFIEVFRKDKSDTIEIIKGVEKKLENITKLTKGKVTFEVVKNDLHITRKSISSVIQSAILGTILAILVIFLFLHNLKATIIIGISIPLCILLTFIGFYLSGITLNILSLSGITVALGMIVDPSIVVLEHINKKMISGYSPKKASVIGVQEVGSAVIASATTSICVFAPLLYLSDVVGIFMGAIGKTMIFALSASILVALLVVPFLTSKYLIPPSSKDFGYRISIKISTILSLLDEMYRKILDYSLRHGRYILFFVISIFIISIFSLTTMGTSFIPSVDSGEFEVSITYPDGNGLNQSLIKSKDIENIVLDNIPYISSSLIVTRSSSAIGYFTLIDKNKRSMDVFQIIKKLQGVLSSQIVDAQIKVRNAGMDSILALATGGQGFIIDITGNNLDDLSIVGKQIEMLLKNDPGVISTEISIKKSRKEAISKLKLDRLGSLGITPYEVAATTRILFNGEVIGKYTGDKDEKDIRLVSDLNGKPITEGILQNINFVTRSLKKINYGTLASFDIENTIDNIKTVDRLYSVQVKGLLNTSETGTISKRISENLKEIDFPIGIEWSIGGSAGLWSESLKSLILVLGVAIFLVYAVMVIQFERFSHPLIIMASIPFCLIGVVIGLNIFGSNMSIIAFLALISLGGIVVNNAIVLIDYINLIRQTKKINLRQAILEAGSSRIQPILMTTLTTMFGVIPLAIGSGEGSGMYAPLGQAIFGGLITSTLITLILVPVLYYRLEMKKEIKVLKNKKK